MAHRKPREIELTSKKWKLQQLFSFLLMLVGAILFFAIGSALDPQEPGSREALSAIIGAALVGIGLIWYLVVRALIWWNHG